MHKTLSVSSQDMELDRLGEAVERQVSFKSEGDLSNGRKHRTGRKRAPLHQASVAEGSGIFEPWWSRSLHSQSPGGLQGGSGTGAGAGVWTA